MRPPRVTTRRTLLLASLAAPPLALAPLGFACAAAPPALAQTAPSDAAQAVIAAARQATGGAAWDRLTTTRDHGRAKIGGLAGTYDTALDWVHLRQAQSYALGPATGAQGYDGKQAWSVDSSGQVRVERSAEATAAAIEGVYLSSFAMFFPGRYPAEIVGAGTRTEDGKIYQAIRITPKGADPVEMWFDAASHLPNRVIELSGPQPSTTYFSDFRTANGVTVPFHTVTRVGNDPKYDQVADLVASEAVAVPDSRFAPPPPPPYDAVFPAGKTAVSVKMRLLNNHIYLPVSIDGKPAVPFMFDTGATNFLDLRHARSLGVTTQGALPGGGFGSAISAVGLARVASVAVGGLALHDQVFATNDLGALLKVEGADMAGLIGYEFAKRTVVTIDYAHGTMTFTRPEAFHPPAGVAGVPFTFASHVPMVQASVDGVAGQFEIDTGSRGSLTLMRPFAQANKLVDKYHATVLATTGYGVGGPSKALLGRAGTLTIGGVAVRQPVVDLVMDAHGAAAATRTAGNIGGDLLKRFTLTLDYGHQMLYFQPNALADQPDVFDRSGLWVNRSDTGAILIADITPGSAAAAAGLKIGDSITAVDGKDARLVELFHLREMFKASPGTELKLRVTSPAGTRIVKLRLADQV